MILLSWVAGGVAIMVMVAILVRDLIPQSRYAHPLSPFAAWFALIQTCILVAATVAGMHLQHQHNRAMLPASPSTEARG